MRVWRRLAAAVTTLVVGSFFLVLAFVSVPGDPAAGIAGDRGGVVVSGLPVIDQQGLSLERLFLVFDAAFGDPPGYSWRYEGLSVLDAALEGLPVTLGLSLGALLMGALPGITLGLAAATAGGRWVPLSAVLFTATLSVPLAALVAGLVFWLALSWRLVPAAGWTAVSSVVIPMLAMAIPIFGAIGRAVWGLAADVMPLAYIRAGRAKGLSRFMVAWRHVLPNIAAPLMATLSLALGWVLSGALVVETLLEVPGIGREAVKAVLSRDYPVALGCMLVMVALNTGFGVLADLVAWRIDRRPSSFSGFPIE